MLLPRILTLAAALSLGAVAGAHDDGDSCGFLRGEAALTAVADGPQASARGSLEVETGTGTGTLRQRLEVEVRGADPSVALSVFLDDGSGVFADLGVMVADDGERELEIDTSAGATLPFGVASVELLAGLAVEVRDASGAVVLTGTVPPLGAGCERDDDGEDDGEDDGDDDDDADDDGDHESRPARGVAALMRAEASPFPDARGRVEVEARGDDQELEIEAERLDGGTTVEFFLADEGGTMTAIGSAGVDDEGEAEIEFEGDEGDGLPLGATTVAELAGRRVEVRTADGVVILFGEVPGATTAAAKARARADLRGAATKARCRITALVDGRAGRESLQIELKAAARGGEAEILLDDGGGTMTTAATVLLRRSGRGWARYDTKKGDALPLGVSSVRALAGRAFEVRVEGSAVVAGTFPEF